MFPGSLDRAIALGGPAFFWLSLFFAIPLGIMVVISLAERGPYGVIVYRFLPPQPAKVSPEPGKPYGGESPAAKELEPHSRPGVLRYLVRNYERAFDSLYLQIYGRSLAIAGLTTLLCLFIGYPIAYYIALKAPPGWRGVLLMLVVIPFWTSFLVRTYAWMLILRNDGLLNTLLFKLQAVLGTVGLGGVLHPPYDLLYNDLAVLVGLVYGELPFMILPLFASIQKLDVTLLEASQDLGATPLQGFFWVTLPLTKPGVAAGVIFVFIPSIGNFVVPDLMGGSKTIMVGNLIQNQFVFTRDLPFGSAVCFLLTALVLAVLFVNSRISGRQEEAL
jgi:spermidine/putrescine transport system permease protein